MSNALRIRMIAAIAWVLMASLLACSQTSPSPSATPPAQRDSELVKDFEARVAQYMKLRTKKAGSSPKPTSSTTKLADTRDQMAERIRALRSDARQGDLFTPPIAGYFRRQIAATLAGPQGKKIRASLKHAEPVKGLSLKINEPYPSHMPLQSTPPSLLLKLPQLPKELEYRIVDDELVLHDTAPNIIVDFISHVFPPS